MKSVASLESLHSTRPMETMGSTESVRGLSKRSHKHEQMLVDINRRQRTLIELQWILVRRKLYCTVWHILEFRRFPKVTT